jgi:hypothetical protein
MRLAALQLSMGRPNVLPIVSPQARLKDDSCLTAEAVP